MVRPSEKNFFDNSVCMYFMPTLIGMFMHTKLYINDLIMVHLKKIKKVEQQHNVM